MHYLLMDKNGFIALENIMICNISLGVGAILGVPSCVGLLIPGVMVSGIAATWNIYRHCMKQQRDALFVDVCRRPAVRHFSFAEADEASIIKFFGQIARLMTPNGTLFNWGEQPSIISKPMSCAAHCGCDGCGHSH